MLEYASINYKFHAWICIHQWFMKSGHLLCSWCIDRCILLPRSLLLVMIKLLYESMYRVWCIRWTNTIVVVNCDSNFISTMVVTNCLPLKATWIHLLWNPPDFIRQPGSSRYIPVPSVTFWTLLVHSGLSINRLVWPNFFWHLPIYHR
jgi:hypothetical protein